jgi:hypothetical protein
VLFSYGGRHVADWLKEHGAPNRELLSPRQLSRADPGGGSVTGRRFTDNTREGCYH